MPINNEVVGGSIRSGSIYKYWTCCKPSCSWAANAEAGNETRQWHVNMNIIADKSAISLCNDRPATTSLSQIPFTIDSCYKMGFAFAKFLDIKKYVENAFYLSLHLKKKM